ncbi:MAG TPA: DNA methyltransferase [Phycisphaerae bacterium]|nr:DNA methyltransferase [Phycisphaerae bacterium]
MYEDRINRLRDFVEWVRAHLTGDEKGEAQVFLDHLFKAFGRPRAPETGKFETRVKTRDGGTTFADFVWKPIVLIEMKKRGADLSRHLQQAFDYWGRLVPGRPQYVVLCNFDEFWIYDFDQQVDEPMDRLTLEELPDRFGPLNFLFPTDEKPVFEVDRFEVTSKAADRLADCFKLLKQRNDVGHETAQRFILQLLISLFAEDIGLLPKYFVAGLVKECSSPSKSYDLFNGLFTAMATPGGIPGGRFKEVPYFNGGIFQRPAPVELEPNELNHLNRALEAKWSHVSPDIFGTIFQHSMKQEDRRAYGGHYTTQIDIMKIVKPTIVDPWTTLIENATTLDELHKLRERLGRFRVLDPACGSGNFLYIAYKQIKRLEARLVDRIQERSSRDAVQRFIGHVTTKQFFGLDINPFAVELAKVTMSLAHKLVIDELHIDEKPLPLDNLDYNIHCIDALIDWPIDGSTPPDYEPKKPRRHTEWPATDVIIGNPPFVGAKLLKPWRGADYVNAVRRAYPEVPGMADYCVYWFRRAHDHLPACTAADPVAGRAGLVGTQNIRNNQSRVGGLDHIVKSGVIVEAVENQPWSGEANVHVSIVNWVKTSEPPTEVGGRNTPSPSKPSKGEGRSEGDSLKKLLIPDKRKLWFKVLPSLPLLENGKGKRHTRVETPSKRREARKDKSYELDFRESSNINSETPTQHSTPPSSTPTASIPTGTSSPRSSPSTWTWLPASTAVKK